MIINTYLMIILFGFFVLPFFQKKTQNKNKVGIKTTFLLMMKMYEAKIPTQVHFRLGRDERIFFLKTVNNKQNYLIR